MISFFRTAQSLDGKPIIITGASSGIGAEVARHAARAGMPVIAAARRKDRLDALVASITESGGRATAVVCDVANASDCQRLTDVCVDLYGAPYAVFANAGYGLERSLESTTDDELRALFDVNLFGMMHAIRPALPHMHATNSGHIIATSSCLARMTVPMHGAYCATKAAQAQLMQAMRAELKNSGIRVSTLFPIGTATEFFDELDARSGGWAAGAHASVTRQSADAVAKRVIHALRYPREEIWTGPVGALTRLLMSVGTAIPPVGAFARTRIMMQFEKQLAEQH